MTSVEARTIKGNLAYCNGNNRKSLLDAIGPDVVKYLDDFTHIPVDDTTGLPTAWTNTLVQTGAGNTTVGSADYSGGALAIVTDNADNDGANCQLRGESFKLASGNVLYFGVKVKLSETIQSDLFVGLAITDTDILGGITDGIGFKKVDGSATLTFILTKNSTTTTINLAAMADGVETMLEFYFDGTTVEVFVDGVSVATPAVTNLVDDEELRPSVHFLTGEAAIKTATIDWIRCIQIGR
jgi:hypothetical protein